MLAFQTRKVTVKSLKDSTFVAANVYISSTVIVVFILVTFVLRPYLNAYSAIFATGIFILTTTFLMLTFVPKVLPSSIVTMNCLDSYNNYVYVMQYTIYLRSITRRQFSIIILGLVVELRLTVHNYYHDLFCNCFIANFSFP